MHFDDSNNRFVMDIPSECPNCGEALETDYRYGNQDSVRVFLICQNANCDYETDATCEFEKVEEANVDLNNEED